MPKAISKGVSIHYEDQGRGEPALLLMPGWCSSRKVFDDLIPRCSRHRRTLAVDWRGHGDSDSPEGDFGSDDLLDEALAVIQASGVRRVVPIALAHAGWIAVKLRQELGDQVPELVHLEWIVSDPPPRFLEILEKMQSASQWKQTVDQIFAQWLNGADDARLTHFLKNDMGSHGFEMWSRAAREILGAYVREGNPLKALSRLNPPVPVLHLFVPSPDPAYLPAQESFAAAHPWYTFHQLDAQSHFPMFEVPKVIASAIEEFVCQTPDR